MNIHKLENLGFKVIETVKRRRGRELDDKQLRSKFKRIYNKEATENELKQYRETYKVFTY